MLQHLLDAQGVAAQGLSAEARFEFDEKAQALGLDAGPDQFADPADQRRQQEVGLLDGQPVGVDARQFEHVVEQLQQVAGGAGNLALAVVFGAVGGVEVVAVGEEGGVGHECVR